ncbi:MAG TPA: N-methyl-L-tryptophan oxidase [Patescibacteria group bacterium]|nr:N-methyl-L-tryptophan oxidase [Patescibacteria group bacterium]
MRNAYDVIVIGLGAMGSATAHQLAARGKRVLGLDRFSPPHDRGSSHGETRITRTAIGEGAQYVPFVRRSNELIASLEQAIALRLRVVTGGLIVSSPAKTAVNHVPRFFENTIEVAKAFDVPHELLSAKEMRRRFPPFRVKNDEVGYYEPEAGYLRPEHLVSAQLGMARALGADIRRGEAALEFGEDAVGPFVRTSSGTHRAERVVLSAGAWIPEMLGGALASRLVVRRQVLYWFEVDDDGPFHPKKFPVFFWELQGRKQGIYGFPAIGGRYNGIKVATEQVAVSTTPDGLDREVSDSEKEEMYRERVEPYLQGVRARCLKAQACLYTVSPDAGFVIDRHPEYASVTVVSACSGHGFKHSPAVGEAVAQEIVDGKSVLDLSPFRLSRFKDSMASA